MAEDITTAEGGTTPQVEEKTFTQAELNAIVGKRLAEEKAKQVPPDVQKLAKERDEGFAFRDGIIATLRNEKTLRDCGITDEEDILVYGIRISQLVTGGKTFDEAAADYFKAHPRPTRQPAVAIYGVTGKTPLCGGSADHQLREAMGLK